MFRKFYQSKYQSRKQRQQARTRRIHELFETYSRKYSVNCAINMIADRFFLSPETIENILKNDTRTLLKQSA